MKRTLIVKLGAIGDVVMALPMLEAIWKADPAEQVDWVVGQVSAPILQSVASTKLRILAVDERSIFRGTLTHRVKAIFHAWRLLGFRRYDRILLMNADRRYGIIPIWCRGRRIWFRRGEKFRSAVPGRHHSVEYVRMVSGKDDSTLEVPEYPEIALPTVGKGLDESLQGLSGKKIAICPAGAKNIMREEGLRRWSIAGYKQVMISLRSAGYGLVLLGGPGDEWASQEFDGLCDLDLVGKLDLLLFASVLSRVDAVITHDSGPLHVADLVGTPVIGIFGPTMPSEKAAIRSRQDVVWGGADLPCRPCYDGRQYAECSSNICLSRIDPNDVVRATLKLIGDAIL